MAKKPKIAVIYFPGLNCENETKLVCEKAGMDADIIRWNSDEDLDSYDGFIIPGGWSYEDRIRAGAVSAKDPLMLKIKEEAKKGKVVLGICNGCQVLIETGLVPGNGKVEFALAPNINPFVSGYYCTWVKVKNVGQENAFNKYFSKNEILDIPIAHAEGRFITNDDKLVKELRLNGQIMFRYCDSEGECVEEFPINPNGSVYNIAGITNKEGNVLAMMPHPERAFFKRQLKEKDMKGFDDAISVVKTGKIFESIRDYIISRSG